MPALRGSLTYARFFVDGTPPDDLHDRFLRSIRLRAQKPLAAEDEDAERTGWCRVGEPFELELDFESVFYNDFLNLGFRTDRWAIPGSLFRSKLREAEQAYLGKKGRERLSRTEKAELKELVARRLRKQLSPSVRCVDLSWSLSEGVVRFFSHATKPAGQMQELFEKTFDLKLVPEGPYTLASRLGLSRPAESAWANAAPAALGGGS